MSARRGAQFVPIGMLTICSKTFPPKTTKMLSTRNYKWVIRATVISSVHLQELVPLAYSSWQWLTRQMLSRLTHTRLIRHAIRGIGTSSVVYQASSARLNRSTCNKKLLLLN